MTASVRLEGFADLERALEELGKPATRKAAARRALKKAAQPLADLAASLAPDDPATGGFDLRSSITVGTRLSRNQTKKHRRMFRDQRAAVEMFVGPGPLPQAIAMEFGTSPFINRGLYAGSQNPGVSAQPFMRPAWDQDQRALLERLGREMWAEIEKTSARLARRASRS